MGRRSRTPQVPARLWSGHASPGPSRSGRQVMRKAVDGAGSWRSTSNLIRASLFAVALTTGVALAAKQYGSWSSPLNAEKEMDSSDMLNTTANDGCPILSPYDNSLY